MPARGGEPGSATGSRTVSWADRLTAGIGGLGWAGAAVLGATVLVGRSGPLPSLRWLLAALLFAAALGRPPRSPDRPRL